MKIIAFSGSNHSRSINQQLVGFAAGMIRDCEVEVLNLRNYDLPIYGLDLQRESGIPGEVQLLREKLLTADGFIVASPEHNGSIPAFFKNIIDWLSRIDQKIFNHKPVLLLSTSTGKRGGATNLATLEKLLPFWGAEVTGSWSLGSFSSQLQEDGQSLQPEVAAELRERVQQLCTRVQEEVKV